jgi:Tripartite tricarboxylate transporter TctB family
MARVFGTELSDYLPATAAAGVAAIYLGAAYQYSPEARATPLLIGWTVMALAGLDIASRTQTPVGRTLAGWLNPVTTRPRHSAAHAEYPIGKQVMAIVWIAGFLAGFALIGATYAIPLYVFAATRWRGGRSYVVCLVSAAATLAGIWFLFGWLLRLELYPGLLFGGS